MLIIKLVGLIMIELRLDGKVALVTGGNNPYGIGASIAKSLASQGASVFLHYFRQEYDIPFGNKKRINAKEKSNNRSTINAESHDCHFAVNTRAVALSMGEFTRRFIEKKKKWGKIINISADLASGCPAEVSYRASKYALESYSRSAAAELGPYGITVNVVSPGPIQTGYIDPEIEKALIPEIPLGRVGKPEDVANAVLFLVSEQANWITGQLIFVHGGHRMSSGQ
jgi:NAD(P)-dependent dehydrogenase (short-subunit alcohol dehydrogenase family)